MTTASHWTKLEPAPIVLLRVKEPVIGDRAVDRLKALARKADPNTEITSVDAAGYRNGQLEMLTSPSLFGEPRMVIVPNLESLNEQLLDALLAYMKMPEPDVVVLLRHNGGTRGKKLLDAITKSSFPRTEIEAVKRAKDKADLVRADVSAAGRKISPDAVGLLVEALGSDLRELLSAVSQLVADVDGVIDLNAVRTYYSGRIEASGYDVANAAITGATGKSVALARHAMATGVSSVAIIAALASKVRTMGLVLAMRGSAKPGEIKLESWQIEAAKRDMRGWSAEGLARAISVIAQADADAKGASRDKGYAVENAILDVGRARRIK